MRSILFVGVVLGACSFRPPTGAGPDGGGDDTIDAEFPIDAPDAAPGAARKRRITIDPAQVTGNHTQFPVWVVIDGAIGDRALPDGRDIFFTRPDGSPIPYERQRWDQDSDHLEAWVRIDLSDTAPTELDLRYGDAGLAHPQAPPEVFANGYAAVWHLESTTTIPDATGAVNGTPSELAPSHGVTGSLGRGIQFDGGTGTIAFANPLAGNAPHTISLWVRQTGTTDNDALIVLGTPSCGRSRWLHSRYNAATVAMGFYCNDWPNPGQNIIDAGPTLLHWVYDGTFSRLYRNGALVAGPQPHNTATQVDTQGPTGHLGWAPGAWGPSMGAHAMMDEVRIARVVRTADYIATEHRSQQAPSTFYSVGAEQAAP
ncbi:MAG: LamG-like jellyroll fold domain-containing protein [Kofleriaceae bacterium]